jgi:predicted permease
MQSIVLLVLSLAIGVALWRFGRLPDIAHTTLNTFIIYVAFPALILGQVHGLHLEPRLLLSILTPWVMFVVGAALFWLIARFLHLPPTTTGALMLTGGLGNTSFIGLPMIEAFYGKSGIATGILIDTLGTYLVLSTLGVTVACVCSRWHGQCMRCSCTYRDIPARDCCRYGDRFDGRALSCLVQ